MRRPPRSSIRDSPFSPCGAGFTGTERRLGGSDRRRRGFTVIELLVVVTVIGILVALLLPAVQQARETARQVQCRNHLKQLGLALHSYHSSRRSFPPGAIADREREEIAICTSGSGHGAVDVWAEASDGAGFHGTSWLVHLLPHIDEGPRYDRWDFATSVSGNREAAEADIPTFYCPSRRSGVLNRDIMFGGWEAGGNDYGGCLGACNGFHNCGSHESWLTASGRRPLDLCRGVFWVNRSTQIGRIEDGSSNTLLLGELQRLDGGTDVTTSRDGWAVGSSSTLFSSCSDGCEGINAPHFEEPGSAHPGGANFCLADGSVRFVSETINQTVFSQTGSIAGDGPSEF